jgi:hypothetical protein
MPNTVTSNSFADEKVLAPDQVLEVRVKVTLSEVASFSITRIIGKGPSCTRILFSHVIHGST